LGQPEQAVLCTLMLRGPQTPGELKQRSERMYPLADLAAVHAALETLIDRDLARRLDRRPGHKEERYVQLLDRGEQGEEASPSAGPSPQQATPPLDQAPPSPPTPPPAAPQAQGAPADLEELLSRVERLEREVAELRTRLRHPV
ncbi:MAG TPA: DUF480 domain-containing protein, partial [Solirubrobacteraceae bacterium]|nr:DUF480 domain-containing protein [Solirubrobacteraceae bacterium]